MVRTWALDYTSRPTADLHNALKDGWLVKKTTPFMKDNSTIFVEYILEKVVEE